MDEQLIDAGQFQALARPRLSFVEAHGFRRAPEIEVRSPTVGTVAYLGSRLGLIFSIDVRDQCVDARVVQVKHGSIQGPAEGGASSDLFTHLVTRHGYRGHAPAGRAASGCGGPEARICTMLDEWAELVRKHAEELARDAGG